MKFIRVFLGIGAAALLPFTIVQFIPDRYALKAHIAYDTSNEESKRQVITNSSLNLARLHQLQSKLPQQLRSPYFSMIEVIRKFYFHPIGDVFARVTNSSSYRYL